MLRAIRAANAPIQTSHNDSPPLTVSHYTDASGLLGILRDRELWATDTLFMNDSTESRWASSFFFAQLEDCITRSLQRMEDSEDERLKHRLLEVPAGLDLIAKSFNEAFDDARFADLGVYAICFCEDGDLLSQWRGYTTLGGGYSVQVAARQLQAMTQRVMQLSFVQVLYDRTTQQSLAKEILEGGLSALPTSLAETHLIDPEVIYRAVGEQTGRAARTFSLRAKNPAFREEREWRLLYRQIEKSPLNLERQFRATTRGVTPYVAIPTDKPPMQEQLPGFPTAQPPAFANLPVVSVTVGPTADFEVARRSLRYLLADNDMTSDIRASEVPLRR